MFSLNSHTGFNFITCHVRLVYSQPTDTRFTDIGNIPGSIEVSMYLKTAFNAVERIAFPVTLVDMSAVGTFLTGIAGVNGYNRFTSSFSLVSQKLLKLVKAPIVKLSGELRSSDPALNSYAAQIFNSEHIKGHSRNFLGDVMVNPGYKPFFLSANLPKKFFSGMCAFALKLCSKVCVLCPHVFDGFAVEKFVIGSNRDIDNPSINPKNLVSINRFRRLISDSYMQVKSILLFVVAECGGSEFPVKILPVIFRDRENGFYPAFSGRKGNNLLGEVDITNSFIVSDSGILLALREFLKFDSFKSFTGNISNPLKDRARKFRIFSADIVVSSMVDRYLTASIVLKTVFSNLIKHLIAELHGLSESFFVLLRQFQFKLNCPIHIHILPVIKEIVYGTGRWDTLPPRNKFQSLRYPALRSAQ